MDNISLKKRLYGLTMPIFVDIALVMLLGAVDTIMLSSYSDDAVAAVGLDNQLISFGFLIFQFVSMGAAILCAQYFGAKLKERFMQIIGIAIICNLLLGIVVSGALYMWAAPLLTAFGLREDVLPEGVAYLKITGALAFFQALSLTFSAVLRSTGNTIKPMLVTVSVNIINIFADYALIFGNWGCPAMGVEGAAWATAASRIVSALALASFMPGIWSNAMAGNVHPHLDKFINKLQQVLKRKIHRLLWQVPLYTLLAPYFIVRTPMRALTKSVSTVKSSYVSYFKPFPWQELKNLIHIGIPAMSEEVSYSLSQITITFLINHISTEALTTKVYCSTTIMFVVLFSTSIVQGGNILVGHFIGQLRYRVAYILGNYVFRTAMKLTLIVSTLLAIGGHTLMSLLTDNEEIVRMGTWIFCIDLLLSYGRVKNVFACGTLRTTGDAIYPIIVGVICQWSVAVGVAWFLGIPMGLGLIGIWVAFCLDENLRGIILMRRWHSLKWKGKAFV